MPVGFVLVITAPAKEHEVYDKLKAVPEVKELYPLFGEYDFIAKIVADDLNALGRVVVDRIRKIDGIIDTKTLTSLEIL